MDHGPQQVGKIAVFILWADKCSFYLYAMQSGVSIVTAAQNFIFAPSPSTHTHMHTHLSFIW